MRLAELCRDMATYFLQELGIRTPLKYSSEMRTVGAKDELVLDLCQQVKADTYYSGALGRNYLREDLFRSAGIHVHYQDYRHPAYRQVYGPEFEPYMGIVDLLVNCGPGSLNVLTSGQEALV